MSDYWVKETIMGNDGRKIHRVTDLTCSSLRGAKNAATRIRRSRHSTLKIFLGDTFIAYRQPGKPWEDLIE